MQTTQQRDPGLAHEDRPGPGGRAHLGRAVTTAYVGAATSALGAAVAVLDQLVIGSTRDDVASRYPDYTASQVDEEAVATTVGMAAIGVLGVLIFVWSARVIARRSPRAVAIVTTLCVIGVCLALTMGAIPMPAHVISTGMLPCLVGLVVTALVWIPSARAALRSSR